MASLLPTPVRKKFADFLLSFPFLFFSSYSATLILGLRIKLAGTRSTSLAGEPANGKEVIPRCLLESRTKKNLLRVSRGGGGGGEGRRFSLPSFILSGSPVYFFLPSSPTWIVEGDGCEGRPCEAHKLGILKFPVERSYFSPSIFFFSPLFSFFFSLLDPSPSRSAYPISALVQEVARLIFKRVREDFERLFLDPF